MIQACRQATLLGTAIYLNAMFGRNTKDTMSLFKMVD